VDNTTRFVPSGVVPFIVSAATIFVFDASALFAAHSMRRLSGFLEASSE
jgi:hypothetical protein